jgi:hypothetical protein
MTPRDRCSGRNPSTHRFYACSIISTCSRARPCDCSRVEGCLSFIINRKCDSVIIVSRLGIRSTLNRISVDNLIIAVGFRSSLCWCLAIVLAVELVRDNSSFVRSIYRSSADEFFLTIASRSRRQTN